MPATEREGEMTRQTIYVHHKQCFSRQGGECDCIPTETKLATPTADTGLAGEIAETLWGVTEEQSRALQTPYCTYEPPSEDFKQATIRRYTEAIASRLSTREQEVGELVRAADIALEQQVRGGSFTQDHAMDGLRAALDKARGRG